MKTLMLRWLATILISIQFFTTQAQTLPAEKSILNYRLVGFEVPEKEHIAYYRLEIADGINNNETYFNKNRIITQTATNNHIIALVPAFGKPYTWRVTYMKDENKAKSKTPLYHFTTGSFEYTDSSKYRLRVIQPDTIHKKLHLFVDATKALYGIDGQPVWYLPEILGVLPANIVVRDLKMTPQHTITFLAANRPFEVDYNGKILWTAPNSGKISNDTTEFYHHEFTRLASGNYMVAGNENVAVLLDDSTKNINKRKNGLQDNNMLCGTLIEYDSAGNVKWYWRSSEYFINKNIFFKKHLTGGYAKTHLNSFFPDEKNHFVYVSFRDISTVLKISYPEGNVVASYGTSAENTTRVSPFYGQHNCRINKEGDLYLFNNNALLKQKEAKDTATISSVLILKESPVKDSVSKAWEFYCNIDTLADYKAYGGGSVYELNDNDMLVSMGTINRLFIVSRAKQVLWNALVEMKNSNDTWSSFPSYRASVVEMDEDLERLVFSTHKAQQH